MAIAVDSIQLRMTQVIGTSLTVAHTCTGTDRFLIVYVYDASNLVTGVTYAGNAMTLLGSTPTGIGGEVLKIFGMFAPSTGANNVVVTSSASNVMYCSAQSYTGVFQSITPDAIITANPTSISSPYTATITTVASNCWTFLAVRSSVGGVTASTGSTFRSSDSTVDGRNLAFYDSNGAKGSGSNSMAVTFTGTNTLGVIMFSLAPSSAPTNTSGLLMLFG